MSFLPLKAPMFFAKKKDGTCINYGGSNNVKMKKKCSLSMIDYLFNPLQEAVIFSKNDMSLGYYQLRIRGKVRIKKRT